MSGDLMLFFGRFHPVFVHLPIGLLVLLGFLEVMARWPRFQHANINAGLILGAAVPLSILTAGLGWLLSTGGGYDAELLRLHQITGFATAGGATIAGIAYAANWKGAYRGVLLMTVAALGVTSHFGGSLTHGRDYLTRYAPPQLREWFKKPKPASPQPSNTPQETPPEPEPGNAQPLFSSAIAPVLDDKCVSCHGPEKAKGGLRVDSLEALLKGGDSGPGVVPGKPGESEIVKRMLLPLDHDDHMPPDGKPQPTAEELALLKAWIEAGASATGALAGVDLSGNLKGTVTKQASAFQKSNDSLTNLVQPLPRQDIQQSVAKLVDDLGVPITFLGQSEAWIQVNASIAGRDFGDEQLARITALGPNLRWLDLSGTSITAEGLKHVSKLPNLSRLYLQRTSISEDALTNVATLSSLEYLNLYGTRISGKALNVLKPLPNLRQLYLWQTQVTAAEGKAFAEAKVDRAKISEWERQIADLKERIRTAQVIVDVGVQATNSKTVVAAEAPAKASPINSVCPVSGKPVDAAQTFSHEGMLIGFCCEHCKGKFQQDPKAYQAKISKASE